MYSNTRLFDVLTRHQIYVEKVKVQHVREFNNLLRELDIEFRELFSSLRFRTLDAMTKTELRLFLLKLKKAQSRVYSAYITKLIGQLETFMQADIQISKRIFVTLGKEDDETPVSVDEADAELERADDGAIIYPVAWFLAPTNGGTPARLWSSIANAPIPANGVLIFPFIKGFVASASISIENIVRKGYANHATVQDVIDEITGTKAKNFRDGAFARINTQAGAVIATAMQHVTSIAQASLASIFFKRYRWVSVIDSVTTEICRGRNGRIFRYGEGPLPPAHIRCRSKTAPFVNGEDSKVQSSYYDWMKSQPNDFQDDILGAQKASDLRSGKVKSNEMSKFEEPDPLTVEGFISKLNIILTR